LENRKIVFFPVPIEAASDAPAEPPENRPSGYPKREILTFAVLLLIFGD
jgi:hypothetical protein